MTREAIEYFKFYRKIFCEDHLKTCPKDSVAYRATLKEKEFYDMAIKALEQEPKTGHWIKEESVYGWDGRSYQCSECGRSIHLDTAMETLIDYPYCHCGAKMVKPQEGEDT